MAQQGHAAGAAGHDAAIAALGLHLVFVSAWLGGLVTLVLLSHVRPRPARGGARPLLDRRARLLHRGRALGLRERRAPHRHVGASSAPPLRRARDRQGRRAHRARPVRRRAAPRHDRADVAPQTRRRPARLLAARRGRARVHGPRLGRGGRARAHRDPVSEDVAGQLARTPAEILTGEPLPPWPESWRYFTEWSPDLLWLLLCGFGIFFYLAGVIRLRSAATTGRSTARCCGSPACCCSRTSRAAA